MEQTNVMVSACCIAIQSEVASTDEYEEKGGNPGDSWTVYE